MGASDLGNEAGERKRSLLLLHLRSLACGLLEQLLLHLLLLLAAHWGARYIYKWGVRGVGGGGLALALTHWHSRTLALPLASATRPAARLCGVACRLSMASRTAWSHHGILALCNF